MQEDDHVRVQVGDHLLSHLFSHDARSSSSNCCCARSRSSSVPLMVSRLTRRDSLLGLFSGTRRMRRPLCATSTNSPCSTRSTIWKRFLRNSVLVTFPIKVYRICGGAVVGQIVNLRPIGNRPDPEGTPLVDAGKRR